MSKDFEIEIVNGIYILTPDGLYDLSSLRSITKQRDYNSATRKDVYSISVNFKDGTSSKTNYNSLELRDKSFKTIVNNLSGTVPNEYVI